MTPKIYPCGCSHLKVEIGMCDAYRPDGTVRIDDDCRIEVGFHLARLSEPDPPSNTTAPALTREAFEEAVEICRENFRNPPPPQPEIHAPWCPKYVTGGEMACRCGTKPIESVLEDDLIRIGGRRSGKTYAWRCAHTVVAMAWWLRSLLADR